MSGNSVEGNSLRSKRNISGELLAAESGAKKVKYHSGSPEEQKSTSKRSDGRSRARRAGCGGTKTADYKKASPLKSPQRSLVAPSQLLSQKEPTKSLAELDQLLYMAGLEVSMVKFLTLYDIRNNTSEFTCICTCTYRPLIQQLVMHTIISLK